MRNIAPVRVLSRRSNQLLSISFVIGAIGIFVTAIGILLFVVRLAAPSNPQYELYLFGRTAVLAIGFIILIIALALALRAITWKKDNDLAIETGRFLETLLDDRYTFIRNVSKREIGYVDAVLVGPPGVLVYRILNKRGIYANEGVNWLEQNKRGEWLPAAVNPSREVIADVRKIREFLAKRNLGNTPVYGIIVFITEPPLTQLMAKEPTVPVTHLKSLHSNLQGNYFAKERIDKINIAAIARYLLGE